MFLKSLVFFVAVSAVDQNMLYREKIVARVGTQIILSSDLQNEIEALRQDLGAVGSERGLNRTALSRLVDIALIREYLKRLDMGVSDQDVDRRINSIRVAQGISSNEEFRQLLKAQGLDFAMFRERIREQMLVGQFNSIVERQTLQTTDEQELRAYYQNNIGDFSSTIELEIQECLIPYTGTDKDTKALAKKVEQGEISFAQCVSNYSRSPSAQNGGSLGKVRKGLLRPEIEEKVFNLQTGQITSIDMPGAIQLLRVAERKDLGMQSFESVQDEIRQRIQEERVNSARERLLTELRNTIFIQIDS